MRLIEPYRARAFRFLGVWDVAGFRLKATAILHQGEAPDTALVAAARERAQAWLTDSPTRQTTYGVGFLGIHDGRGENQVFLDVWCNENELLHTYWISPKTAPGALARADADHNSVCVWDLALQSHERAAWLRTVLANPDGPDLERYLATHFFTGEE